MYGSFSKHLLQEPRPAYGGLLRGIRHVPEHRPLWAFWGCFGKALIPVMCKNIGLFQENIGLFSKYTGLF